MNESRHYRANNLWTFGVVRTIIIWFLFGGLCVYTYFSDTHVILLILASYLFLYPTILLFCRYICIKHNECIEFSIDMSQKAFACKYDNNILVFRSTDVKEWRSYKYGTRFASFVEIIEFRLNDGEKIYISSGIEEVETFLRINNKTLELPEENFGFGLIHLYKYIKNVK